MNKNEANAYMANILTNDFCDCLTACLVSGVERIRECQNALPPYLTLQRHNRLYSDLSSACIGLGLLQGHWDRLGLIASEEARGAYTGIEITGEALRLVVVNASSFKPGSKSQHIADCIGLNSAVGHDGQRGVFLLFELDEGKILSTARLVMRSKNHGELVSVSVYPSFDLAIRVS